MWVNKLFIITWIWTIIFSSGGTRSTCSSIKKEVQIFYLDGGTPTATSGPYLWVDWIQLAFTSGSNPSAVKHGLHSGPQWCQRGRSQTSLCWYGGPVGQKHLLWVWLISCCWSCERILGVARRGLQSDCSRCNPISGLCTSSYCCVFCVLFPPLCLLPPLACCWRCQSPVRKQEKDKLLWTFSCESFGCGLLLALSNFG